MQTPTNIITGFLGSGKTTAILNLLKNKPANENWAVLVNEFGEIGIDGAILTQQGTLVKQVPGGCMCCAAGVPTSVAITSLLRSKPDRLIIEPTGLGHADKILATLMSDQFREHIDLKATLALVDPRNLSNPKYLSNDNFIEQLSIADIVIGNKVDLCTTTDTDAFNDWVAKQDPPKINAHLVKDGQFPIEILDNIRGNVSPKAANIHTHDQDMAPPLTLNAGQHVLRRENSGQGYYSCGWLFSEQVEFCFDELLSMLSDLSAERIKGVMKTDKGVMTLNISHGVVSVSEASMSAKESRIEVIDSQKLPWEQLDAILQQLAGIS
ncbi:GTP-binding protein [Vibrio sp. OCN044]|uniref:GTP-binding protein n=1 Tax=Vibrio tetraodonis subsp. pristinus TaxID=2695891 RepID=A0A6L8M026_9VIBR|nr:GTP-binding protein [Vibrio tetraodonis]MYM61721.1 GTP-binding protein [Vibrio tetraodonis subsp. pristinus]